MGAAGMPPYEQNWPQHHVQPGVPVMYAAGNSGQPVMMQPGQPVMMGQPAMGTPMQGYPQMMPGQ